MRNAINVFLALIKWPMTAIMMIIAAPAFVTILEFIHYSMNMNVLIWFGLPFIIVAALWLFMPGMNGSFLAILEHELTHMFFALLTFHKPVDLDVHQDKGGSFSFQGKGNWLIAISPYFFPLFPMIIMLSSLVYFLMNEPLPPVYGSVFGVMVGYHLASTILQIHPGQTDFKKAGYVFSILFLPGANLIVYGVLIAYACMGWKGLPMYVNVLLYQTGRFVDKIF